MQTRRRRGRGDMRGEMRWRDCVALGYAVRPFKGGIVGRGIRFRSVLLGGAVAAALGAAVERAVATDRTWTNNGGAGGFAWGTAGNWSPAGVPGAADKAI